MNAVAGETGHLIHIEDDKHRKWLVDGGALVSLIPPTFSQKANGPKGPALSAANGSSINCYGIIKEEVVIEGRAYQFEFIIADVQQRILGADFLAAFYLAPNHRDGTVISLETLDIVAHSSPSTTSSNSSSINRVASAAAATSKFDELLQSYPEITTPTFTLKEVSHGVEHHIPTGDNRPVQSRARPLSPEKLAVAKAEIEKLVQLGVCKRGKSEWSSPLLVTTKPDGGWRVCGDFRRLNAMTPDDKYPVRSLSDFTAELHGKRIFSKVDLLKGYHQVPVRQEDVKKTAVITPFGLFTFPRTPFGLKNAGQDFQRLMDEILGDVPRVFVYIDDILVASETEEQHLEDLRHTFDTLKDNGLVVNRKKCVLGQSSIEFLGYHVDSTGIKPLEHRVHAIRQVPPPTTIKELQSFLGMVNYYRKFVPHAAHHMAHLFDCLKGRPKTLTWTSDSQNSFDAIKEALAKAALLHHPRPSAPLALTTDASKLAIGGVLEQLGPKGWEPLGFYSSRLQRQQQLWPPYDRELLAAWKGVRHFRQMLEGRAFTLYTDHESLVPSISKKSDPQTARQQYQLSGIAEYTTDIRYIQGKSNVVADALSRPPSDSTPEETPISAISLSPRRENNNNNESASSLTFCLSPAASQDSAAATAASFDDSAAARDTATAPAVRTPPNGAAEGQQPSRTKDNDVDSLNEMSPSVSSSTPSADAAMTESLTVGAQKIDLDATGDNSRHPQASTPFSTCVKPEAAIDLQTVVNSVNSDVDFRQMAQDQPLDPEYARLAQDARTSLHFRSVDLGGYNLIVDTSNGPARPWVPLSWRRKIFDLIHGLGHPGVHMTQKAVAAKFVWPRMRQDVAKWARDCLDCQRAKVTRHVVPPVGEFVVPNRRFEHVNVDLVTMPLSNGHRYLLTVVDRFTRWPAAIPLKDASTDSVMEGFAHGWIANFGVPASITTDRGAQFTSAVWTELMTTWGIKTHTTTPYHPEANGMVERLHRRLKESILALGHDEPEKWFWRLPCTLLAIRTTLKPDIGASPAELVYGEGLAVPGTLLNESVPDDASQQRLQRATAERLRLEVERLQPTSTSNHRRPRVQLPENLRTSSHVFVKRGGIVTALQSPYTGPYRVVERMEHYFRVSIPGRGTESISISRLKPAFVDTALEDAGHGQEAAIEPQPRRGPGRPPSAPPHPPHPPHPPRRGSRRPSGQNIRAPQPTDRRTRGQQQNEPVTQQHLPPPPPLPTEPVLQRVDAQQQPEEQQGEQQEGTLTRRRRQQQQQQQQRQHRQPAHAQQLPVPSTPSQEPARDSSRDGASPDTADPPAGTRYALRPRNRNLSATRGGVRSVSYAESLKSILRQHLDS